MSRPSVIRVRTPSSPKNPFGTVPLEGRGKEKRTKVFDVHPSRELGPNLGEGSCQSVRAGQCGIVLAPAYHKTVDAFVDFIVQVLDEICVGDAVDRAAESILLCEV